MLCPCPRCSGYAWRQLEGKVWGGLQHQTDDVMICLMHTAGLEVTLRHEYNSSFTETRSYQLPFMSELLHHLESIVHTEDTLLPVWTLAFGRCTSWRDIGLQINKYNNISYESTFNDSGLRAGFEYCVFLWWYRNIDALPESAILYLNTFVQKVRPCLWPQEEGVEEQKNLFSRSCPQCLDYYLFLAYFTITLELHNKNLSNYIQFSE